MTGVISASNISKTNPILGHYFNWLLKLTLNQGRDKSVYLKGSGTLSIYVDFGSGMIKRSKHKPFMLKVPYLKAILHLGTTSIAYQR